MCKRCGFLLKCTGDGARPRRKAQHLKLFDAAGVLNGVYLSCYTLMVLRMDGRAENAAGSIRSSLRTCSQQTDLSSPSSYQADMILSAVSRSPAQRA